MIQIEYSCREGPLGSPSGSMCSHFYANWFTAKSHEGSLAANLGGRQLALFCFRLHARDFGDEGLGFSRHRDLARKQFFVGEILRIDGLGRIGVVLDPGAIQIVLSPSLSVAD